MNNSTTTLKINTSSRNSDLKICTTAFMIEMTGSRLGGQILHELEYRSQSSKQIGHTFYVSIGPSKNKRYGNTPSLCERLHTNPRTIRRHLKRVAQNLNREKDIDPNKFAYYRTDKNGVTHWEFNRPYYNKIYEQMCGKLPKNEAIAHIPSPSATMAVSGIGHSVRYYKDNNIVNNNVCVQREEVATEKPHTQSLALIQSDETLIAHFKKQTCSNHEVIQEFTMRLGKRNVDIGELYDLANEIHGRPDKPIGPNIFRKFIRREKPENHEPKSTQTSKPKSEVERTQEHAIHDIYARYTQHKRRPEIGILTEHQEREYERILLSVGAIGQPEVLEHMPYRVPMRMSDILSNMSGIKRLSNKEVFQKVG